MGDTPVQNDMPNFFRKSFITATLVPWSKVSTSQGGQAGNSSIYSNSSVSDPVSVPRRLSPIDGEIPAFAKMEFYHITLELTFVSPTLSDNSQWSVLPDECAS